MVGLFLQSFSYPFFDPYGNWERLSPESILFQKAKELGMDALTEYWRGEAVPSQAFAEGGIHEAIIDYENNVFFDILAEDLARRDMDDVPIDESNYQELAQRIEAYISEFEQHGTDHILVDTENP